jgi:hypothetical protein
MEKPTTKTGAIRASFQELGGLDAVTAEVVRNVRKRYRMDVKSTEVSQFRSNERAKLRNSKEGSPSIPGLVQPGTEVRETAKRPAAINPADIILTVKDAAQRVGGMEQLKAIIQALEH